MAPKKVLIVEDSIPIAHNIATIVESLGYQTITAHDGEDGLSVLQSDDDIMLCISDINMPVMDGLTMLENVRSSIPECTAAFIFLTTEFKPYMKKRGKELDVKCWIVKPVKEDRLKAVLNSL